MDASSPAPRRVAHGGLTRFGHLVPELRERLFLREPASLRAAKTAADVGAALGAVLYTPATNAVLGRRLVDGHWPALTATVVCLEDAIGDHELPEGEAQLGDLLSRYARAVDERGSRDDLPLLFVRVRSPGHLARLLDNLGSATGHLDGVVLPKFEPDTADAYLDCVASRQASRDRPLWAMPILEGSSISYIETRRDALRALNGTLSRHAALIPCVRIGGTDISGTWGLRRSRDTSIYELAVVRDIIADIVNVLGRPGGVPAISGPVWEWFADDRVFHPRLRETPFRKALGDTEGPAVRKELLSNALDGLLHETLLDRANGLHGKSAIHPTHLLPIDAAHVVGADEWHDAQSIVSSLRDDQGASASIHRTRMNEPKPHAVWADRVIRRANAFGVLASGQSFLSLL